MTYAAAKINIRAHFATRWGSTTPVAYENLPFTKPDGPWARFQILNNFGEQASLGGPTVRYRQTGLVIVSLFDKENAGPTVLTGHADTAINIFRKPYQFLATGERFRNASIQEIGVAEGWYQIQVRSEFTFDEII